VRPTVIVLAKAPEAGRSKTRLIGAWTPQQAADLAEAALVDTLTAVAGFDADLLCVLDGATGPWLPAGVAVVPQADGSLGERIAAAFATAFARSAGPVVLVGMDTPQLTARHLAAAVAALGSADACLGRAADGGWWCLGLRSAVAPATISSVPTSRSDTGALQRAALVASGLSVADLPVLTDVDTPDDALAVAALAPDSRFARLVAALVVAA
jgi:rSAM/selenodomain-associated transferase 1